ncbi:exodeoxyribonuclease VII large subunit [Pectinatus haikarae]|uniref:exodeoxyribonuclease VII large subunit n=1 Tax=Pectinatus haikarae TaxID=349096 RepID=UPI0018C4CBFB|nr:exodeoxyribonuclease VII large subunit [Pectinatus haikarae]
MAVYSVSQINSYISEIMSADDNLKKVMIRGEISNFKLHSSGHCYLTLKDDKAAIKSVIFRRFAQKLRFRPENGLMVIACGSISVYERDGTYQLYIEQLIADGAGALSVRYEQLKNQLEEEGLFSPAHKKNLPVHPKCVGIITSKTGAVLHDIFRVAFRRDPSVKLLLFPVPVQGKASSEQLVAALKYFNQHRNLCDVIIIGRGGGSMEDLWPFNDEGVVRAVYSSAVPVISAVGHETDFTLIDFVSDVRAATPSHAAELCIPSREEWLQRLSFLEKNIMNIMRKNFTVLHERLNKCINSIVFKDSYYLLGSRHQQMDQLFAGLDNSLRRQMEIKKSALAVLEGKASLLDPEAAMKRGYSLIYKDKVIINSVSLLSKNDKLKIILADGQVLTSVEDIVKDMQYNGKEKEKL